MISRISSFCRSHGPLSFQQPPPNVAGQQPPGPQQPQHPQQSVQHIIQQQPQQVIFAANNPMVSHELFL